MTQNNDTEQVGFKAKKEGYTVEVKYSPEAIEKKLIRFTTDNGDQIVLSAEEIISMLVGQVNMETLAPMFVDTEKINVVQVQRQLKVRLDEDMKKGQEINLNYEHPYPLEFALVEEIYKIAKIKGLEATVLTKEFIEETKGQLQESHQKFVKNFYKTHKQIDLEKKDIKN